MFYIYLVRKSSVAQANLLLGQGKILINKKDFTLYMQNNPKMLKTIRLIYFLSYLKIFIY